MKLTLLVLVVLLVGCTSAGIIDANGPNNYTFRTINALNAGDRIKFDVLKIAPTENLHFYLCRLECRQAREIAHYKGSDFGEINEVEFTAPKTGSYYFWLRDSEKEGEESAIPVVGESFDPNRMIEEIDFKSGSILIVHPNVTSQL
ncbi:hypothetical protein [Umboniibacter marinipuniceus]|uniref:Lipoprotein n=1 Tax=Umboniibacter marinipuniceus TaxID=569599 RepID=A0A3M0A824_9GAMM|nr:hypothetical protein [Umboniibacter marinipuniceus]RMA78968.1 hypothetical protein DFR27_2309 [Umboniibacter marinipuniceus]